MNRMSKPADPMATNFSPMWSTSGGQGVGTPGRDQAGSSGSRNRNRNNAGGNNRGGGGNANGGQRRPNGQGGGGGRPSGGSRPQGGGSRRPTGSQAGHGRPRVGAIETSDAHRHASRAARSSEAQDENTSIRSNRRRALFCCVSPFAVIGLILAGIIAAIGFPIEGAIALLVVSILGSWWSWCSAPHLIVRSLGARDIGHDDHHRLHNLVEGLCATMGLPTPEILIIDSPHPNALSVGRDPGRSSLVVTSSLEGALTLVELEGVLAHELVHIKRHDMVVSGVAVSAVMLMTRLVGATTGARLVHRFVGEGREFSADQRAAGLVRYPGGLGSALRGMANAPSYTASNPERWRLGFGRRAGLTRWLWVDPMMGSGPALPGELDATGVRADALMLL